MVKKVIVFYSVKTGGICAIISLKTPDPILNTTRKTRREDEEPCLY
jgi:hypothetical protein